MNQHWLVLLPSFLYLDLLKFSKKRGIREVNCTFSNQSLYQILFEKHNYLSHFMLLILISVGVFSDLIFNFLDQHISIVLQRLEG